MSKEQTPTPHNAAKYGEIAGTMIMAGDPLRVKFIAENWLEDPVLVSSVRGMYCYTGSYKGKKVSVMAHGMGIPSIGIYTYELFNFYDVQTIIRIGTCGTMEPETPLGSILLARSACTDSNYGWQFDIPAKFIPNADFGLLSTAVKKAEEMDLPCNVGGVLTSDVFYDDTGRQLSMARFGVTACEMEAYGLYLNAAVARRKALTILTVTDNMVSRKGLSAEERQLGLSRMIDLAFSLV